MSTKLRKLSPAQRKAMFAQRNSLVNIANSPEFDKMFRKKFDEQDTRRHFGTDKVTPSMVKAFKSQRGMERRQFAREIGATKEPNFNIKDKWFQG